MLSDGPLRPETGLVTAKVERALRATIQPGERMSTPTGRGSFTVARNTSDGVTLLLGAKEAWTPLPWRALEEIPDLFLAALHVWRPIGR
jgi:hypothetical protein